MDGEDDDPPSPKGPARQMRDSEASAVPFSEWDGQVRPLAARGDARPTDVGMGGRRIAAVEARWILRMTLDFWFVISIRVLSVAGAKKQLPGVTTGYQELPRGRVEGNTLKVASWGSSLMEGEAKI